MPKETIVRSGSPSTPNAEPKYGLNVGWNRLGWVQISTEPWGSETTGDWSIVDLDRGQINVLIRALRKARDQAYGADA